MSTIKQVMELLAEAKEIVSIGGYSGHLVRSGNVYRVSLYVFDIEDVACITLSDISGWSIYLTEVDE